MTSSYRLPGLLAALTLGAAIASGCSGSTGGGSQNESRGGAGGSSDPDGASGRGGGGGSSSAGASGAAGASSGGAGGSGQTGSGSGAAGGAAGSGSSGEGGSGPPPPDAAPSEPATGEDASAPADAASPDTGPPTYEGALPLYEGPPVGPEVKMACPEDPTAGWTEYKDTFKVQRPYDVPINTRFKLEDGIYTFWIMRGDRRHSPTSSARNPRSEARFSENFTTGERMWSADVKLERNLDRSVIMQVHTTATGIGPVYLHVEGNRLAGSSIQSSDIPGGMFDNWFNMKVAINAATTESKIYINNCLESTQRGTRGDGVNYFKMGVYHCERAALCRDHFKNVRLYRR